MKRRSFTLIELLVVIAIIAILAAILFPVFAKAREKGRQASCASNQKELALALLMYAGDYDESFPGFYSKIDPAADWPLKQWVHDIQPYVKNQQIFVCPSGNESATAANTPPIAPRFEVSYAVNPYVVTGGRGTFKNRMALITQPAQTVLTYDALRAGRYCAYPMDTGFGSRQDDCRGRPAGVVIDSGGPLVTGRDYGIHNEGANVSWTDGHVKWMKSGSWETYSRHYALYWQKSR